MGNYDRPYKKPSFAMTDQRLKTLQLQQAQLSDSVENLAETIELDETYGELKTSVICLCCQLASLVNQVGGIINGLQDANISKSNR